MKKLGIVLMIAMVLSLIAVPMSAADSFTVPGTHTPPVIDGEIDSFYMKINDFYSSDSFKTNADPDKSIKGSAYATYDKDNFYFLLAVETPVNENFADNALDMGVSVCGYLALLSTAPGGGWTDDSRFEAGIALSNDGQQMWKVCSPANIKDSSHEKAVWAKCPFTGFTRRDEASKYNFYEFQIPWSFLDRTGKMTFAEGSKITLNYSATIHKRDEYSAGKAHYMEYGGGVWNGGYEDGAVLTLGAIPILVETTAAAAASGTTAVPAAQTGDTGVVLYAVIAAATLAVIAIGKKQRKRIIG